MANDNKANNIISTKQKGQAWFCSTSLPSDVIFEVEQMTFHLHKFPLMSKSKKLHELITKQEKQATQNRRRSESYTVVVNKAGEQREQEQCQISLVNFPGGSKTFETAAKFCYGVKIELTHSNVASLRCAGEVLEMTEEYSENNLVAKTDTFLAQNVLTNIKDSIKTLKSCENLIPLAENLGIVENCIKTISSRALLYDATLFGWPVNAPWVDDLSNLAPTLFNRVISAMKRNEIDQEILESCLIQYANRCFLKNPVSKLTPEAEQREVLENIITHLSPETMSNSPVTLTTTFLFGLLRTANTLGVSKACKSALEMKIGAKLEEATLDDLLFPSYSYLNETLYDIDCVHRILNYFVKRYEEGKMEGESGRLPAIMLVGKLFDGYLSEIASDLDLKPEKFCELVGSLPEQARLYDDGVYRAVDLYLKAHPLISEQDREKISGVMNCEKLTLEACTHAAQNERLPLRTIVQVLFFEQLQLRQAIEASVTNDSTCPSMYEHVEDKRGESRENEVLRLDMDSMRARVHELERECSTMKKFIDKIDTIGAQQSDVKILKKGYFGKKFGCKFGFKVCDSQESIVIVDAKKGKYHSNSNNHQR